MNTVSVNRNADPAEGGTPPATPATPLGKGPQPPAKAPEPQPPAQAPPAAKIVLEGTKTEREVALERDLKSRETRVAELEDENHRLKTPPTPPAKQQKKSWLSGRSTFFDED